MGINEKHKEIEIERRVKKTEPVSDLSWHRTRRSMQCFSLYGVLVCFWIGCVALRENYL